MDLGGLKQQLKNVVQAMFDEEILDSQFNQIQALQDSSNPNFVHEVITLFCSDAERIIAELHRYLGYPHVDFSKLDSCVHQLKGSSSSIGAHRLKVACVNLRQASDDRNKERCIRALSDIKQEYYVLRGRLQFMFQLQRTIIAIETNQH